MNLYLVDITAFFQTFMEEMTRKQPDVDKVTKTYKRRAADPSSLQSHIPVLEKGRAGRKRGRFFKMRMVIQEVNFLLFWVMVWRWDFSGGSDGKASAYNVGDPSSIPGSGTSPGEGNGTPLQYSCLENPMDGGAW